MVVFAVILLLFGAKRLPSIARTMGRTLEEFRRAARDFSSNIMRADRNDCTDMHMDCAERPKPDKPVEDENDGANKHDCLLP